MDKSSLMHRLIHLIRTKWVRMRAAQKWRLDLRHFLKGSTTPYYRRRQRTKAAIDWRKLLWGAFVSSFLFFMLASRDFFLTKRYTAGDVFDRDIYAWRTVEYISMVETQKRREGVIRFVEPVYRQAHDVNERILQSAKLAYKQLRTIALLKAKKSEKLQRAKSELLLPIDDRLLPVYLKASPEMLSLMESYTMSIIQKELDKGIKPTESDLKRAKASILNASEKLNLRSPYREAVAAIAIAAIQPNLIYDAKATHQLREKVMRAVPPVRKYVRAGELIARRGEVVSDEHLEKLMALGINFVSVISAWLFSVILTWFAGISVQYFLKGSNSTAQQTVFKQFGLVAAIWLPLLFVQYLLLLAGISEGAIALISTAAMVTCILLEAPSLSALLSGFACFIVGMVTLRNPSGLILRLPMESSSGYANPLSAVLYTFGLATISFMCSIVGIYMTISVHQRSQVIYAGTLIGLITFLGRQLLYALIGPISIMVLWNMFLQVLWNELILAIVTGIATSALTLAMVSMLERAFKLVTAFTLLELANSSTGILRELAERAPGTYQSSLMVAALARAAAEAIGANSMLAYVGGLYHDIGKLKRPHYFSENQRGQKNPHDETSPSQSADILKEHVKEGVRMAEEIGLPESIVDFIREHHGTSLMQFFYMKALSDNGRKDEVTDERFRYPGPKPRSKETAIVMLADAVEAAVSAHPEEDFKTPEGWERVERIIDKVIRDKIEDGQLDESPLSYAEIEKIREVFKKHLRVSRMQRVQYPETPQHVRGGSKHNSNANVNS